MISRKVDVPVVEMEANSGDLGMKEVKEESSSSGFGPFDGAEDIESPLAPSSEKW